MGAFVLAAGLIVGFVAWRANELLTNKVIETLAAEVAGLREQFQAGGADAPAHPSIAQRVQRSRARASTFSSMPRAARSPATSIACRRSCRGRTARRVFNYARAGEDGGRAQRLAVGVPLPVPGGLVLIVGRDIEDQRRFAGTMGQRRRCGASGCSPLLGIGAGLAVSRSVLRPHRGRHARPAARSWPATCRAHPARRLGRRARPPFREPQRHARPHRGADGRPARGLRQHRPRPQDAAQPPAQSRRGGAARARTTRPPTATASSRPSRRPTS